jgi:hypothetical protein
MAIVPFMGEGDEIVGSVIGRLLAAEGIETALLSWRTLRAEKVERLKELKAPWILLSAMESRSVTTVGDHVFRAGGAADCRSSSDPLPGWRQSRRYGVGDLPHASRRFDAEDHRVMSMLGQCAGSNLSGFVLDKSR